MSHLGQAGEALSEASDCSRVAEREASATHCEVEQSPHPHRILGGGVPLSPGPVLYFLISTTRSSKEPVVSKIKAVISTTIITLALSVIAPSTSAAAPRTAGGPIFYPNTSCIGCL